MNFGSLSKAAGGLMSDIKAKAKEAAHDAADSARRATQQVLETAGVSDKGDDDDLPELKYAVCQHRRSSPLAPCTACVTTSPLSLH